MRRILLTVLLVFLICGAAAVGILFHQGYRFLPRPVAPPNPTLGVNYCDWSDNFGTPESLKAMTHLRGIGVKDVVFVATWYQKTTGSTSIHRLPKKTPSDDRLATDLKRAKELGFRIGVKFHIDPEDSSARSNIAFKSINDFEQWWKHYRQIALHYARIAKDCDADSFSIGCELSGVVTYRYTWYWESLIEDLRGLFGPNGPKITYSARHQNVANIGFLDRLDIIGINAWPYFHNTNSVSLRALRGSWRRSIYFPEAFETSREAESAQAQERGYELDFFDFIRLVSDLYGKPVMLTELGCQSKNGALSKPVDWWYEGAPDVLSQAMFFEGFFSELREDVEAFGKTNPGKPYPLVSVLVWNYMIKEGGPMDTDYTFRNKPLTERVLRRFAGFVDDLKPKTAAETEPEPE